MLFAITGWRKYLGKISYSIYFVFDVCIYFLWMGNYRASNTQPGAIAGFWIGLGYVLPFLSVQIGSRPLPITVLKTHPEIINRNLVKLFLLRTRMQFQ